MNTFNEAIKIFDTPADHKPMRSRIKALLQLIILEDRKDLISDLNRLYQAVVQNTRYPEELLKLEMGNYKQKLKNQKELEEVCQTVRMFPNMRKL